jgi:alkylation response protein AidB-like acyl-CoA dehydrogenase
MNFDWTADDLAFKAELEAFVARELPPWWRGRYAETEQAFQFTVEFCKKLAEKGWLTLHWPKAYGGEEASIWKQVLFKEVMWAHDEPRGSQYMAVNWIGPAIMAFGTPEQKREHLGRIRAGEAYWAQGFSEPNAGSDLASLQTRAVQDGDDFVINGQKIWTSHTRFGEWIFLCTRTNTEAPKHRGISVFLAPLKLPGVTVRQISSLVGVGELSEVFFEDVRVPRSWMLGEKDMGWYVMTKALNFERIGAPRYARSWRLLNRLRDYAQSTRRNGRTLYDDPLVRQRFARLETDHEVARLLYYQVASLVARDIEPSHEASLSRVHATTVNQKTGQLGMDLTGADGQLNEGSEYAPVEGLPNRYWREFISATIAAGTLEIQKNLIATRGLGLPRG